MSLGKQESKTVVTGSSDAQVPYNLLAQSNSIQNGDGSNVSTADWRWGDKSGGVATFLEVSVTDDPFGGTSMVNRITVPNGETLVLRMVFPTDWLDDFQSYTVKAWARRNYGDADLSFDFSDESGVPFHDPAGSAWEYVTLDGAQDMTGDFLDMNFINETVESQWELQDITLHRSGDTAETERTTSIGTVSTTPADTGKPQGTLLFADNGNWIENTQRGMVLSDDMISSNNKGYVLPRSGVIKRIAISLRPTTVTVATEAWFELILNGVDQGALPLRTIDTVMNYSWIDFPDLAFNAGDRIGLWTNTGAGTIEMNFASAVLDIDYDY